MSARGHGPVTTAREAGVVGCRRCGKVSSMDEERCGRCGGRLHSRRPASLQKVWAWWIVGLIAYIPANTYPMLLTTQFGSTSDDTIIEGALHLYGQGSILVATVVIVASVVIPVSKFGAIAYLATTLGRRGGLSFHRRLQMYEAVEFIGRWSMIDVFVVAILSALVQFSLIFSINPGPAVLAFGASVVFTMLSAQSFDPRMIWDAESDIPDRTSEPAPERAADRVA